jgi:fatty-acyl-CoA synthase
MNLPLVRNGADSPQRAWTRALEGVARATRDPARTLPHAVEDWAERYGDVPALIGEPESYSFTALAARINQYARWGLSQKIGKGEAVALMMRNRPEYVAIWLGLTRIGAVVALLSPDLRGEALRHALEVSGARLVICAPESERTLAQVAAAPPVWTYGPGLRQLDDAVALFAGAPLIDVDAPRVELDDRALRIFTSGTTGLPKAAEVSHRKIITWTHWFSGLAGMGPEVRLYNCLPMHHSVGGVVAIGAPLVGGGSVAIAEKFSRRGFWRDIERFDCNAFQYIGELCRYLTAAPPPEAATRNRIKLALGNGLAAPVWRAFAKAFPETRVLEFYASTEGNVWLYNVEGRIGALGRLPAYLSAKSPIALVRFDEVAQAPVRGPDGFCLRCEDGAAGEALGRIAGDAASRFEGYSDQAETEKKILRNVFAEGDAWMRTGDLMRRDADGFYLFVDRVGDTFRWKGENVSIAEVTAALRACPGVIDALVYGVKVPHAEGRAGMATLTSEGPLDFVALARRLETLSRWARPLFLRCARAIERTETFKPKRALYAAQGFDPGKVEGDALFVWDQGAYRPLDAETFARIGAGTLRL